MNSCFFPFSPTPLLEISPVMGNGKLVIRVAEPKDIKPLAQVLTESFHSRSIFFSWLSPLFKLGLYEDLRNRLNNFSPSYVCLVATIKNNYHYTEVVGTVELSIRSPWLMPSTEQKYVYISNLAVKPDFRRQGIAGQLLLCCEKLAFNWGFKQIHLHVLENNDQAQQLYWRNGYQIERLESTLGSWLLYQPRRLFLHKNIINGEN